MNIHSRTSDDNADRIHVTTSLVLTRRGEVVLSVLALIVFLIAMAYVGGLETS